MIKAFSIKNAKRALTLAKQTLQIEADAILALKNRLTDTAEEPLARAIDILLKCKGRIIISGIGKSGHIGRKIAATFTSTGAPALFMHPTEAAHGDLGIITKNDVFIAISNSGKTEELIVIIPIIEEIGAKLIAMTGNNNSTLAKLVPIHLNIGVSQEACTLNLAPTTSTIVTQAMGDALAISLLDARGFLKKDFARSHPGGTLGRRLLIHVRDIMRTGNDIPVVTPNLPLTAALMEIARKGMAMTAIVDKKFHPIGIFTDDDLYHFLERGANFTNFLIADIIHRNPHTILPDQLAIDAGQLMKKFCINQILVTDIHGKLIGALHIHDLTRAKVI